MTLTFLLVCVFTMKIHKEEINKLLISVKDKQCGDLGMLICSGY